MPLFPYNPNANQTIQSNVPGSNPDMAFLAHYQVSAANAVAASTTGIRAAVTDNGSQQVITTGITNPAVGRNVTATAGGTAGDIKAIQVIVAGTDMAGNAITETLPAFTVDTAGSVTGTKIFKTVTSITIPAHDGTGATTALGWGSKLGFPHKLTNNTVVLTFFNNTKEGTAPTVTVSATALESNGFTLNSSLNGSVVDIYYLV
jgi:hypothetical protein